MLMPPEGYWIALEQEPLNNDYKADLIKSILCYDPLQYRLADTIQWCIDFNRWPVCKDTKWYWRSGYIEGKSKKQTAVLPSPFYVECNILKVREMVLKEFRYPNWATLHTLEGSVRRLNAAFSRLSDLMPTWSKPTC